MIFPEFEFLRGRVSDASIRKGSMEFTINGRAVSIDMLGAGMRTPFSDGDEVEVVVRRGLLFRSSSDVFAYRVAGEPHARSAPRWRILAVAIVGIASAATLLYSWIVPNPGPGIAEDLQFLALGVFLLAWGAYGLYCHSAATRILQASGTPPRMRAS